MIDFNKFTNYSKEIVASAQNIMAENKNFEMQPEHLLMAMVKDVEGVAGDYLKELGILKQEFINLLAQNIKQYPTVSEPVSSQLYLSQNTQKLFELANTAREEMKDEYISVEHIILAMTMFDGNQIQELLQRYSVNKNTVLKTIKNIRGNKELHKRRNTL